MSLGASFSPPGTGVYYHYTTRASAQEMSIAGRILPGRGGCIFLTDVLYQIGWQATDRLGLPNKNAEVVIAIPESAFSSPPRYLGIVQPYPLGKGGHFEGVEGING